MIKFDPNNSQLKELISLYDEVYENENDIPEKVNYNKEDSENDDDDNDNEKDVIYKNGIKLIKNKDGEYCFEGDEEED